MRTALANTSLQKKAAPEVDPAARSGAPAGTPRFLRRQAAEPPVEQHGEAPEEALTEEEADEPLDGIDPQAAAPAVIQRQGDKAGAKSVRSLGVEDSEAHSRDDLTGMGLHLVNPADHYQKDRDTKGRRVRIERWEDKDGNFLWYRVHEGAALFPVQEASAANDRIAQLIVRLGDGVSTLTEMRKNGQGDSSAYVKVLDQAFGDEAAIWKEIGRARETMPRWQTEVAGDSTLEKELEGQAARLEGLEGSMPSLEDMVDDLAVNRDAAKPSKEEEGGGEDSPEE